MDADEHLNEFSVEKVGAFISDQRNTKKVGRIQIVNVLDDTDSGNKYADRISRLFNRNYFCYEGTIHEQIVSRNYVAYDRVPVDITVYHYGYSKGAPVLAEKLNRNLEALIKAAENIPNDPYLYFQLGKTYFMMKEYVASSTYFEKALTFTLDYNLDYVEDLVETYGYSLINCGRYADSMNLERYLKYYKNSADFHFLLGQIYMNNAKLSKSADSFLTCTKLKYCKMEGVTSFLAFYNIGVIYEVLGYKEQAAGTLSFMGIYGPALERLKQF